MSRRGGSTRLRAGRRGDAVMQPAPEGPLAWLRTRRDKDGEPMIDDAAFAAGERLRHDFMRASATARTTMDWDGLGLRVDTSGPDPSRGLAVSEASTAARARLAAALAAVGPEFEGIIVDVCCHEKGLPDVERERRWPIRSGKVVLRLALAALARHYGLDRAAVGRTGGGARHWGTDDYRPSI